MMYNTASFYVQRHKSLITAFYKARSKTKSNILGGREGQVASKSGDINKAFNFKFQTIVPVRYISVTLSLFSKCSQQPWKIAFGE